jgi:hypothetical protein
MAELQVAGKESKAKSNEERSHAEAEAVRENGGFQKTLANGPPRR